MDAITCGVWDSKLNLGSTAHLTIYALLWEQIPSAHDHSVPAVNNYSKSIANLWCTCRSHRLISLPVDIEVHPALNVLFTTLEENRRYQRPAKQNPLAHDIYILCSTSQTFVPVLHRFIHCATIPHGIHMQGYRLVGLISAYLNLIIVTLSMQIGNVNMTSLAQQSKRYSKLIPSDLQLQEDGSISKLLRIYTYICKEVGK